VRWRCRSHADGDGKGAAMRTGGGAVARGRQTAAAREWRWCDCAGGRRRWCTVAVQIARAADGGERWRARAAQGGAVAEVTAKARGWRRVKTRRR
jgi:hypothetical protein